MITQPPTYVKAIVAGLSAGLSALLAALGGEPPITTVEWVTIALAVVGAIGLVYGIPNRAPVNLTLPPQQPTTRTNGGTGSNVRKVAAREDLKHQFGDDRGGTIT